VGVVRVYDGCRVHRVALAASPVGAAAADEEDEEEEETQAGRRASPRPWRTLHRSRGELSLAQAGGRLPAAEEEGRRAAARGVVRTAASSGPLEMVATFRGRRQIPTAQNPDLKGTWSPGQRAIINGKRPSAGSCCRGPGAHLAVTNRLLSREAACVTNVEKCLNRCRPAAHIPYDTVFS
jgi:hypothetical protein